MSVQELVNQELVGMVFDTPDKSKLLPCRGRIISYSMQYDNAPIGDMYNLNGMSYYRSNPRTDMQVQLTNIEQPREIWNLLQIQEKLAHIEQNVASNIFDPETIEKIQGFLVAIDHLLSKGPDDLMVAKLLKAK